MYLLIYLLTHSFKWYASQCWFVAEVEAPILWPPDMKSQLVGKDPDAGKDFESKRRREGTEDERIKWHHRLNGREFEQTAEDGEGKGSLACCSPWGHEESGAA